MGVVQKTIIEFLLVLAVAAALGFGLNPWRGSDRITLTEDYFKDYSAVVEEARKKAGQSAVEEGSPIEIDNTPTTDAGESEGRKIDPAKPVAPPEKQPVKETKHTDHPYQNMTFDEAADIYEDPNTELGVNVFIDARDDDAFAEGHIPGALQCDRYRLDEYIDEVMEAAMQAEKVIIYCNGGQCNDSKFLCGELIQRGIPYDRVFLFSGGWEEWIANEMQYDTGGVE